jgi:hypothetical protein
MGPSGGLTEVDVVIRSWIESLETLPASRASIDILAVGWATVESERAATALGGEWRPAPRDALLGASVQRSTGREPPILLLEPDSEGRLAGALARHGEGPIALYLRADGKTADERGLAQARTRAGAGPLGRQWLVLAGPPAGPFLLLVDGPAPPDAEQVPSEP